jgi:hypothetical protein
VATFLAMRPGESKLKKLSRRSHLAKIFCLRIPEEIFTEESEGNKGSDWQTNRSSFSSLPSVCTIRELNLDCGKPLREIRGQTFRNLCRRRGIRGTRPVADS